MTRTATLTNIAKRFVRDESGATAIEYSLVMVMVAAACIASFKAMGGATNGGWGGVANKVTTAMQ